MAGETDLGVLLASLRPVLAADIFAFATLPPGQALPPGLEPVGTFREAEGLTVIAPSAACRAAGLTASHGWAMITLSVHSSLAAVGMMAAVAQALAAAGISVNPVAGYHHDHVFVPWDRREEALAILSALSRPA
jgi:hypothetical protein